MLEALVREYELATAKLCGPATFKPTLPKGSQHNQWDWVCGVCGHLVHAGRQLCFRYNCDGRRRDGATVVGSVRGQHSGSSADSAIKRQLVAINAPSNYHEHNSAQGNHQPWQVKSADTLLNPLRRLSVQPAEMKTVPRHTQRPS